MALAQGGWATGKASFHRVVVRFSDVVHRAAFDGEITCVTRGRGHHRTAAIVPADLVERKEAMIDRQDGRIARKRLADLDAGRTTAVAADEVAAALGL